MLVPRGFLNLGEDVAVVGAYVVLGVIKGVDTNNTLAQVKRGWEKVVFWEKCPDDLKENCEDLILDAGLMLQ
jgi:hypothetical protein